MQELRVEQILGSNYDSVLQFEMKMFWSLKCSNDLLHSNESLKITELKLKQVSPNDSLYLNDSWKWIIKTQINPAKWVNIPDQMIPSTQNTKTQTIN